MQNKMQTISDILRTNEVVDIEIATEPKMNKRGNPYYGRVTKHTAYIGVEFGKSYSEEINKRRLAEGKTADFVAQKSPYESVNEFFVRKGEQLYLQFLPKKDGETKTIYEVDGRPATECEVNEFKAFFPKSGWGANQGLEKGNEVPIRVVKIENIIAVGGKTWAKEV